MALEPHELPGSRTCVGCKGLTFRNRDDGLCPRCAFHAEALIEQIELESLDHDLTLMIRFDAYCTERDEALDRERVRQRMVNDREHRLQRLAGRQAAEPRDEHDGDEARDATPDGLPLRPFPGLRPVTTSPITTQPGPEPRRRPAW